jgi:predicted Zn-dependent protease
MRKNARAAWWAAAALICVFVSTLDAQTAIKLPKNRYTPEQDVELGRKAAAEVRQQFPVINDERIARYLTRIGDRLVAAAPPDLKQPVYEYSFTPVNVKEINAFALPGGPMFVHRGMFDAAAGEAEVAGVMAHELCFDTGPPISPKRRTRGCSSDRWPGWSAARWWGARPDPPLLKAAKWASAPCS